ncbi:ras-related protein Rab-7L1-like [Periplaneta americana]|uniref:ras-related protein Rab-7L1-like n=1 Tax=Periplaneta americana TaxID=6978 RepID=UPI0037E98879
MDSLYSTPPSVPERLFKVIIIGDPTVGKTSFVQKYTQNAFRKDYKGTVGVDFALKVVKWSDTEVIKVQLWDIAGQERFTWMTRVYYKDSHGCVIMFDLNNKNSFINALKWKRDVDAKCRLPDGSSIPCLLLANKCDVPHRQIERGEIEEFFRENNFVGWTETSVKEGVMIDSSMNFLVEVMMKRCGFIDSPYDSDSLKLSGPDPYEKSQSSCFC